jgi:hypothetical protein
MSVRSDMSTSDLTWQVPGSTVAYQVVVRLFQDDDSLEIFLKASLVDVVDFAARERGSVASWMVGDS